MIFATRPYGAYKYGRNSYDHWSIIDKWTPIPIDPPIWASIPPPAEIWVPIVEPPAWN